MFRRRRVGARRRPTASGRIRVAPAPAGGSSPTGTGPCPARTAAAAGRHHPRRLDGLGVSLALDVVFEGSERSVGICCSPRRRAQRCCRLQPRCSPAAGVFAAGHLSEVEFLSNDGQGHAGESAGAGRIRPSCNVYRLRILRRPTLAYDSNDASDLARGDEVRSAHPGAIAEAQPKSAASLSRHRSDRRMTRPWARHADGQCSLRMTTIHPARWRQCRWRRRRASSARRVYIAAPFGSEARS